MLVRRDVLVASTWIPVMIQTTHPHHRSENEILSVNKTIPELGDIPTHRDFPMDPKMIAYASCTG